MRGRLLATAVAAALVATPATAAPKSCATITDEDLAGPPSSLDIRKVQVAYGAKTLDVRLTLDTTRHEPAAVTAYHWGVNFSVAGVHYVVDRRRERGTAERYWNGFSGEKRHLLKVVVTPTSITWSVARAAIPQLRKPKALACADHASTSVESVTADRTAD